MAHTLSIKIEFLSCFRKAPGNGERRRHQSKSSRRQEVHRGLQRHAGLLPDIREAVETSGKPTSIKSSFGHEVELEE